MPEYRRFISYFYEYIDGKKQRNTGFAKVELRNGVWRVLFRLTVPSKASCGGFWLYAGREKTDRFPDGDNACRKGDDRRVGLPC